MKHFFLAILFLLTLPSVSFAYETLFDSDVGSGEFRVSSGYMLQETIDCGALGWSEIASTTIQMATVSGTIVTRLHEVTTGQESTNSFTINTTPTLYSFTFSPPIWCEGQEIVLQRAVSSDADIARIFSPSATSLKNAYVSAFSYVNSLQPTNADLFQWGADFYGSFSTSTPAVGSTTNIYNLYPNATSTSGGSANDNGIWVSLIALLVLFIVFIDWMYSRIFKA